MMIGAKEFHLCLFEFHFTFTLRFIFSRADASIRLESEAVFLGNRSIERR